MEKGRCVKEHKVSPVLKKGKKKQAKDELDRLKQAEKKKRRLEKALANSAAIRSELEKKKQKKLEEQQRLDQEGAAIAEAVALHVLLGEDMDESHHVMWKTSSKCNTRDFSGNADLLKGCQSFVRYSVDGLGLATDGCSPWWCNNWEMGQQLIPHVHANDLQAPYYHDKGQFTDIGAELIAAQAVSSLKIAEDSGGAQLAGRGTAAVVINKMLEGSNTGNKFNIYSQY